MSRASKREQSTPIVDDVALPALTDAIFVPEAEADLALFRTRRAVLRDLLRLSTALDAPGSDLSETLLSRFCGDLSRYLSVGHYRAFQSTRASADAYLALAATSREIMRFTDRFVGGGLTEPLRSIREQLGQLAMTLETRFEIEDDLITSDRLAERSETQLH